MTNAANGSVALLLLAVPMLGAMLGCGAKPVPSKESAEEQAPLVDHPRSRAPLGNASQGSSASPSDPGTPFGDLQANTEFGNQGKKLEPAPVSLPPAASKAHEKTPRDDPTDKPVVEPESHAARPELVLQIGHRSWIYAAAFSHDGRLALTGSDDRSAILWDVDSGRILRTFRGHNAPVHSAAFSRDGQRVLTASTDGIVLWDPVTGQRLRDFRIFHDVVDSATLSADGRRVLAGSRTKAILWDADTGKEIISRAGHASVKNFYALGDNNAVPSVAFSPDGRRFLTGSTDHTAILWDVNSHEQLRTFRGHAETVKAVAFSPDGRRVLTGSADAKAFLWDADTGQRLHELPHDKMVESVAFHPDDRGIVTGLADNTAVLWDTRPLRVFRDDRPPTGLFRGGLLSGRHYFPVAVHPDGKRVLTGSAENSVFLWDVETGKKLRGFQGQRDMVGCAAFTKDGRQILTFLVDFHGNPAETKGTCILWAPAGVHKLPKPDAAVEALLDEQGRRKYRDRQAAYRSDGQMVLTPGAKDSDENSAILWDARTGRQVRSFQGHTQPLTWVAYAPHGRQVLTASLDGTSRLWDVDSGAELARLISIDDGQDWAVVTPEGLFDGSREGREKVFYRVGARLEVVPLDRFFQDFYYPGLLAASWRGEHPMPGKTFQISPAPSVKMLVQSQKSEVRDQKSEVRDQKSPPITQHSSLTTHHSEITVDVAVTDQGGGIKAPWLKHNRAAVRSSSTLVRKEGKTEHYRFSLSLVPGENHVEARSATADGVVESAPAGITIPFTGKLPDPELYVVVVGINVYAANAGVKNLRYCVADAEGIADLLHKRAAKSYGKVNVTRLLDDKATKEGILKSLTDLAKIVKPRDTLVFFCASHGVTLGQRYFLIPHDLKLGEENPREDLRKGALAVDELSEPLAVIPALKRVLIFDTCESGSATSLASKDNNPFAFRGAAERLNRAQGVYCLAGAAATEEAAESRDLKHSILTYTLLAGAGAVDKGPLAGLKVKGGDLGLDVLDWFRYARQNVPAVYEKVRGKAQNIEISGEDQPGFPLLTPGP